MDKEIISTEDSIKKFQECFLQGMFKIVEACKIYVAAIDANPKAKEDYAARFPSITAGAWKRYEMIGRGQILPEIATNPIRFSDRAIESFPVSDQKRLIEDQIEVITLSGDHIKVSYANMTDEQKRIAFAKDHIRTLPEQKAFLEKERALSMKAIKKAPDVVEEIRSECMRLLLDKTLNTTILTKVRKILRGEK